MSNYNPQYNREAQIILLLQWIFASILGWAVGILITTGFDEEGSIRMLYGTRAAVMGVTQWFVVRRHLRGPQPLSLLWIVATAGGFMLAQFLSEEFANVLRANAVNFGGLGGGLVVGGMIGMIIGVSLGVPQAILIAPRALPGYLWLLASVIGWGIGFQAATLFGSAPETLTSSVTVLFAATLTGLGVTQFLNDDA